eukprot:TRINITY_DN1043_c0_g1_i4.p1 TRINITY_DN1043_c0_g1~~TRINITY_DN1043_c0_g1_i4.p1  ORF type:complete len:264 (-),score=41.03 TRINITY_DN1043_c0_g1_i4:371-1162(-)
MASLLLSASLPTTACCSSPTRSVHQNPRQLSLRFPLINPSSRNSLKTRTLTISFALAESDSPKSLEEEDDALSLLQELSDSFRLPSDYFAQLPGDLRLDLNDAAFDLANGPVLDECGQELGEMLLNLSRAWEQADTSTSTSIASKFPSLHGSLTDNVKSAFGKRLVSTGRRFQSMGQYGQGELQRIAKVMIKTGKLLSASPVTITDEKPKVESRMFKFGELQVELTPQKANIGAAIGFVYGYNSPPLLWSVNLYFVNAVVRLI